MCVIITDGGVSNQKLDIKVIEESTKHPVFIIGIGVGNGNFGVLTNFNDHLHGQFDNFRFVSFNEIEADSRSQENSDQAMTIAILNEIPDAFQKMLEL